MEGHTFHQKAIEIITNEKLLKISKKNFVDPINLEIKLSLQEITKEVRHRFGLPQLCGIFTTVTLNIGKEEMSFPTYFTEVEMQFNVNGRDYWYEEYVCGIIRVFGEAKLNPDNYNYKSRRCLLHLYRIQGNTEYFQEKVEIPTSIESTALSLVTTFTDICLTRMQLNGRIETLLLWIKARLLQYLMAPIRQTNYNIRLIIFACRKKDGLFGTLQFDIVKIVCQIVLSDLKNKVNGL